MPRAEIRQLREGASVRWWREFLRSHGTEVQRRSAEAGVVFWSPATTMPRDLFSYIREASLCYSLARFLATIALSSALVETILNRDPRLRKREGLRRIDNWILLNNKNLKIAQVAGLPVDELLQRGEVATQKTPLRFVALRNKIAHGDLGDFPDHLSDYSPTFESAAKDQLLLATKFLVAWFNTCPRSTPERR